jgi:putative Holliday junction resolvase
MKLLGIDYGAKRVGIAMSDDGGEMAFAKAVFPAGADLIKKIADLCESEHVEGIVIGESKNYQGKENPIMEAVHSLKKNLEVATVLPVYFEPELMTSMEAERLQGYSAMHDASAAALILKSYIDRTRNSKNKNPMSKEELWDLTQTIRNSEHEQGADEKPAQNSKIEIEKLKRERQGRREA